LALGVVGGILTVLALTGELDPSGPDLSDIVPSPTPPSPYQPFPKCSDTFGPKCGTKVSTAGQRKGIVQRVTGV
jgi:hypothetical protein